MLPRSGYALVATAVLLLSCAREWREFDDEPDGGGASAGTGGGVPSAGTGGGSGGTVAGTGGVNPGGTGTGGESVGGCANGVADGNESDTDCGGIECYPCLDGSACYADADCRSNRCESGVCSATSCSDNRLNGNETDVDCGGAECSGCTAGQSCQFDSDCAGGPQADGACSNGACALECGAGWADCNASAQGCETSVLSDPANCGGCGIVCGTNHTTSLCSAGACSLSCDGGWDDCDADPSNGCEADVSADPSNCGSCNNACGAASTCHAGGCCSSINQGTMVNLARDSCFRIKPSRCDCSLVLQITPGTGNVSVRIHWDAGGTVDQIWPVFAVSQITLNPVSAFTAVVTAIDTPGDHSLSWWTQSCSGVEVPCFDITE